MTDYEGPERREAQEAIYREIARNAADDAVEKMWRSLGYDINEAADLKRLQSALAFAERFDYLSTKMGNRAFLTVAGLIVLGLATLTWQYVTGQAKP